MEKIKFSLIFKIIFLLMEIIFIGNSIYIFKTDIIISMVCFLIGTLIFIFENCFYSYILFGNEIKVLNKFNIKKYNYQDIKRIEVSKSISQAFLIGADIDIKLVFKNECVRKIHLGSIVRYNKLINMIKDISRYRCIKFCIIE